MAAVVTLAPSLVLPAVVPATNSMLDASVIATRSGASITARAARRSATLVAVKLVLVRIMAEDLCKGSKTVLVTGPANAAVSGDSTAASALPASQFQKPATNASRCPLDGTVLSTAISAMSICV